MKYLIAVALVSVFLLLITLGDRAISDDAEPMPTIVDVSLPKRQPPTTTTTAPPTTTTTAPVARTAPTVRAAAVSRPTPAAVGAVPDLIRAEFARFGEAVVGQALRVGSCESTGDETGTHFDPSETGDEGEVGLFQIHPRYHTARAAKFGWTMADLYDPAKNVVVAADLFDEQGWDPWTCEYAA